MPKDEHRPLYDAVEFLCRHSLSTQERTVIINQMIRSFVQVHHTHLRECKYKCSSAITAIQQQFKLRGYI